MATAAETESKAPQAGGNANSNDANNEAVGIKDTTATPKQPAGPTTDKTSNEPDEANQDEAKKKGANEEEEEEKKEEEKSRQVEIETNLAKALALTALTLLVTIPTELLRGFKQGYAGNNLMDTMKGKNSIAEDSPQQAQASANQAATVDASANDYVKAKLKTNLNHYNELHNESVEMIDKTIGESDWAKYQELQKSGSTLTDEQLDKMKSSHDSLKETFEKLQTNENEMAQLGNEISELSKESGLNVKQIESIRNDIEQQGAERAKKVADLPDSEEQSNLAKSIEEAMKGISEAFKNMFSNLKLGKD